MFAPRQDERGAVTFIRGLLLALKRRDRPLDQIGFDQLALALDRKPRRGRRILTLRKCALPARLSGWKMSSTRSSSDSMP